MCGRFALHTPRSRIAARYFELQLPVGDVHAKYNITPGVQITIGPCGKFGAYGAQPEVSEQGGQVLE